MKTKIFSFIIFLFIIVQNSFAVSLYGFDKEGNQKWSASITGATEGRIDFLGGGYILNNNLDGLDLLYLDSGNVSLVKTIETWQEFEPAVNGFGLALNHYAFFEGNSEQRFDSNQVYLLKDKDEFFVRTIDIVLYDYVSGQEVKQMIVLGTITPLGLLWDGQALWLSYLDGGGNPTLDRYDVGTGTAVLTKTYGMSLQGTDIAFDGQDLWCIDNTNVYKFSTDNFANNISLQWAHGLTTPQGMTTDGQQIIIMAD